MIHLPETIPGRSRLVPADSRGVLGAHRREVIAEVVIAELERVLPSTTRRPLSTRSSLMAAGIDAVRLADAIARLEGRYVMRFHEDWLTEISTCQDLIDCVAERMFDPRAGERRSRRSGIPRPGRGVSGSGRPRESAFGPSPSGARQPLPPGQRVGAGPHGADRWPRGGELHELRLPRSGVAP